MIIIVDDRSSVAHAFLASFGKEGVSASGFTSGDFEGWVSAAAEDDVKAVDAFLIGECRTWSGLAGIIKRRCPAAVIALKDETSLETTLRLFAEGMDDVVTKPCHVREILARIEAISRRLRANAPEADHEIHIFRDGRDPLVRSEPMVLPRRELRILEFLVANSSRRVTKAQIFNSVYGLFDYEIDESVIESHICKLRRRLSERLGYDPINSRRYLGYRLVCKVGSSV